MAHLQMIKGRRQHFFSPVGSQTQNLPVSNQTLYQFSNREGFGEDRLFPNCNNISSGGFPQVDWPQPDKDGKINRDW